MLNEQGSILIISLWILIILAIFSLAISTQAGSYIRFLERNLNELKAKYILQAGIEKALAFKEREFEKGVSIEIDALSERWCNSPEDFRDFKIGEGRCRVSYLFDKGTEYEEPTILYGMEDESSRLNINKASLETLTQLFQAIGIEREKALELGSAIIDWRDADDEVTLDFNGIPIGAEENFYQREGYPYHCKNSDFEAVEELLLVREIKPEILYGKDKNGDKKIDREEEGVIDYITIYGDGGVNINTAKDKVLKALFSEKFLELSDKIINYRIGTDGKIGTEDDRWFAKGPYVIDREEQGFAEVKNIDDPTWAGNSFGITDLEWNWIRELASVSEPRLCVKSNIFRVEAQAVVGKLEKKAVAVIEISRDKEPVFKSWRED